MSKFSDHLEQGIMSSGMTEKQLAQVSGFTRSYIALMKNGQRVSPDTEKMTKLIQALNLPPYECEELWKEYIRARVGDYVFERDLAVVDFIHSFNNVSDISIKAVHQYDIPDIKTVNNRMNLEYLIKAVIHNESLKKDGYMKIIMQGEEDILNHILPGICKENKNLKIEHIVCMQKYEDSSADGGQLYNVRMLKKLIPTVIFGNSANYQVFYYYDHVATRFNSGTLLSYMILTSEYVICMEPDMNSGMLSKEPEMLQLYDQLFQSHKKNCKQMFCYMTNMMDVLAWHTRNDEKENVTYTIAQQPCFGVLKVDGLIKKYCRPENDTLIPYFKDTMQKNNQWMTLDTNKHVSYCSREGLKRFMKEGRIDEIPDELYSPLTVEDRKVILQTLLLEMKKGKYELHFLEEEYYRIPRKLFITAYGLSNVVIVYLSEQEQLRFRLTENSMTRILYDSLQNLVKTPQVNEKEDAAEYIRKLLHGGSAD